VSREGGDGEEEESDEGQREEGVSEFVVRETMQVRYGDLILPDKEEEELEGEAQGGDARAPVLLRMLLRFAMIPIALALALALALAIPNFPRSVSARLGFSLPLIILYDRTPPRSPHSNPCYCSFPSCPCCCSSSTTSLRGELKGMCWRVGPAAARWRLPTLLKSPSTSALAKVYMVMICVCVCVCVFACVCVCDWCVCARACARLHVCIYVYVCVCVCVHVCVCVCVFCVVFHIDLAADAGVCS
jgi:hypothetical protein